MYGGFRSHPSKQYLFATAVLHTIVICVWDSLTGGLDVSTDGCFHSAGLKGEFLHPSPAAKSRSALSGRFVSSSSVKLLLSSSSMSSVSSKSIPSTPYSCAWADTSFGIKWGDPSTKSANLLEWNFDVSNRDVYRTQVYAYLNNPVLSVHRTVILKLRCIFFFIRLGLKMETRPSHMNLFGDWSLDTVFQGLNSGLLQCFLSSSSPRRVSSSASFWYSSSVNRRRGSGFWRKRLIFLQTNVWLDYSKCLYQYHISFCQHSPPYSSSQSDRILQIFRDQCRYDDGKGNLLDLNP